MSSALLTRNTLFFILLFSGCMTLILTDHLTSETLSGISSPATAENACAPCGAPCKDE